MKRKMEKQELNVEEKGKKVIITVVSQKGTCSAGHKVGDQIVYEGLHLRGYLCPSAFAVLYRYIYAMRFGVEFPFGDTEKGTIRIACPDADNPVVFELKTEK